MGYISYPFDIDRESQLLVFTYEYYIPAYIDPETGEYFEETFWSVNLTEQGGSSGGLSGYAGESGSIWMDIGLSGGETIRRFVLDFQAFNTFSAVSVAASWAITMAAFATAPLLLAGTEVVDLLIGGSGDDVLRGYGGDDIFDGGAGSDVLEGGEGSDRLDGGLGADIMLGGAGDDIYFADRPGDIVVERVNGGTDTVLTDTSYTLSAQVERLTLVGIDAVNGTGNSGANLLTGNGAANRLRGLGGDDALNGLGGDDSLYGGGGNDTLNGGEGADRLEGGSGNDIYIIDSLDTVVEGGDALAGIDTVRTAANMSSYTLASNLEILQTLGNSDFYGVGNGSRNELYGGLGDDLLQGLEGDDLLDGGLGDDELEGGMGRDTLRGGDGHDTAIYASSTGAVNIDLDRSRGQGGNHAQGDVLISIEGVVGSILADKLYGRALSDDTLDGGLGRDIIDGRGGDDVIAGGGGADRLTGGSGIDTLDYSASLYAVSVDLSANTASGGDAQGDTIIGFENVTSSSRDDVLRGDGTANQLRGLAGNDTILGGEGDDLIEGGAGADWLNGEGGSNRLSYAGSVGGVIVDLFSMVLSGGDAEGDTALNFDHVIGGSGADQIWGNALGNELVGNAGDDRLYGRAGNDLLTGGAGADLLNGGGGSDTASYAGATSSVVVYLESGVGYYGDAAGDILVSIEHLVGGQAGDYLAGSSGNNRLDGGAGHDYLDGGSGNDLLTGGSEGDMFRFTSDYDRDVVADFVQGEDQIFIDFNGGFYEFEQVMALASATGPDDAHTRFDFGGGDVLIVNNVALGDFTASDFTFYF